MATGLGTTTAVKITSNTAPVLILSDTNTNQVLSVQITAEVVDLAGNVQADVQLYYASSDESTAVVDSDGLIIGAAPGVAIITVAAAAFNNTIGQFAQNGFPANFVYQEMKVTVTEQYVLPDFYFVLTSPSAGNYVITQSPETNSTWDETVTYTLGPTNAPGGPTVIGEITGSGTLSFSNSTSQNRVIQGTDPTTGRYHVIFTTWNSGALSNPVFAYPVLSSRGSNGGASGTNDSGQPYVA